VTNLQPRIGFAHAMSKLSWDRASDRDLYHAEKAIDLYGARNQVVGVQVRLYAASEWILTVDPANWLHPLGFVPRVRLDVRFETLPAEAIEVYPVGYVEGDDRRQWMEYFERAGHVEVPAYRPQAVYLRLRIPDDLPPGIHTGRVAAYTQYGFEDETLYWEGTVRLHVADVRLPDVADWSFHLDLWQHCTALARYHHVPLWSDDHFGLIDRYYASLAQLGQKAVTIIATEIPWSGQRCFRDRTYPSALYEHAAIHVERDRDGTLHYDYAPLDRLLDLAAAHGIDREIEIFGLLNIWVDEEFGFGAVVPDAPDAIRIRCLDRPTGRITYLRSAHELTDFIRALQEHMRDLGVLDRVRIAADEPSDLEAFHRRLAFVRTAAPDFRYKAALNHFEFMAAENEEDTQAPPELVDAVPNLTLACRDPALTAAMARRLHDRDGRLCWYICCGPPIPNNFVHSPLVEGELIGWLTHLLNLDGFLRWDFSLWPADPWRRVSWRAPHWSAGDMFFVLPGRDGAPVETLRYEALRTAVQDYELIKLVQRTLPTDQAQEVIAHATACILRTDDVAEFSAVYTAQAADLYSLDPADYAQAQRILLEAIELAKS
jgi:hypothetical protein